MLKYYFLDKRILDVRHERKIWKSLESLNSSQLFSTITRLSRRTLTIASTLFVFRITFFPRAGERQNSSSWRDKGIDKIRTFAQKYIKWSILKSRFLISPVRKVKISLRGPTQDCLISIFPLGYEWFFLFWVHYKLRRIKVIFSSSWRFQIWCWCFLNKTQTSLKNL